MRPIFLSIVAAMILFGTKAYADNSSQFSGFYVGVSADTEWSTKIKMSPDLALVPKSANPGLLAGYNHTFGSIFVGFETRVRLGENDHAVKTSFTDPNPRTIPFLSSTGYCSSCTPPSSLDVTQHISTYLGLNSSFDYREVFGEHFSVDGSMRMGFTVGNFLVFGQLGAGGVDYFYSETTKYKPNGICTGATIETKYKKLSSSAYSSSTYAIACDSLDTFPTQKHVQHYFIPEAFIGFGAEYNIARYFLRAEVELHHSFGPNIAHLGNADLSTARFGFAVGLHV